MVNIYKLELTVLELEILRLLFVKVGKSVNQRKISRLLDVSPPAVKKALVKLEEKNYVIVEKDEDTKILSISLNRDNYDLVFLKRADNLRLIYESGLFKFLERQFPGKTIILFGSYSKGEDTIYSDLDIAIIGGKSRIADLSEYEKVLERVINLNFYENFNKIHINLKENLFNGIVLAGGIEF